MALGIQVGMGVVWDSVDRHHASGGGGEVLVAMPG